MRRHMFESPKGLDFISSKRVSFDGTFALCPKLFKQVFIMFGIHRSDHLHAFPALVFLLSGFEERGVSKSQVT
jgi:hypothetical protein